MDGSSRFLDETCSRKCGNNFRCST